MHVRRERLRATLALAAASLAALLGAAAATAPTVSTAATRSAWIDRGMHVVGGPVAAGGRVLVLVSRPDRSVVLEAVAARTGAVAWRRPAGFSYITAGVVTTPLVHAGVALALVPAGTAGAVRLEGVEVSSGRSLWRSPRPYFVTDAPTACPAPLGTRAFCLVAAVSPSTAPSLVAFSAASGRAVADVHGIERLLSANPGLYQAAASPSALAEVRMPGGTRWSEPFTRLFGKGYDPNFGWNLDRFGGVEAGSIGRASSSGHTDLGTSETIGIFLRTGRRLWRRPGIFRCGGAVGVAGPWSCVMTGTASASVSGTITISPNASLTVEGFDAPTGRTTWRVPARGIADLMLGNVAIADRTRLLVMTKRGRRLVLDVRTGKTSVPANGSVFWCARSNFFQIKPPQGVSPMRVGSSLYRPCDASGRPVSAPARTPSPAVVHIGTTTIWASPSGLEARTTSG